MKIVYITLLVLNFLTEMMASVSLIGGPEGLSAPGLGGQWSMHYGFAALAIASISLWAWPHRSNPQVITVVLGILLVFHTGLFVSLTTAGDQQAGMVLHAILGVLCLVCFVMRKRLHQPEA